MIRNGCDVTVDVMTQIEIKMLRWFKHQEEDECKKINETNLSGKCEPASW